MRTSWENARKAIGIAAVAAVITLWLPPTLTRSFERLREGWERRKEDAATARRRTYGDEYWNGIERVRREIPPDAAYWMVDAGDNSGELNWVRHDLAPRRPRYLGRVAGGRMDFEPKEPPADGPSFVLLVPSAGKPPRVITVDAFLAGATPLPPLKKDDGIPSNIDVPENGARVSNPVVVEGWCQEVGGRPCTNVEIWIDSLQRRPESFERYERVDVAAAVPGIGDTSRAGYRARYVFHPEEAGKHEVTALFWTEDGRYRLMGPRPFLFVP